MPTVTARRAKPSGTGTPWKHRARQHISDLATVPSLKRGFVTVTVQCVARSVRARDRW
ncbi:hypothetical protein ABZS61_22305 [Streptomyces sp. NPDC005566]|uniref:hypothetical protein n=1 Tax=Streptomyces sp. NPDC005566 TaxID=3156886 RepID=UPI0033B0D049